ncbi:LSM domain-containing protein [Desulfurococcus mucosus]|uniref:Putative snRNP Sm-like protein n=1 Tax=Desulfurococcus mucosus (strain ATCC 35584 / DSM 2162 / JCM 9187 / O7/1) TaxID=765177 RepID=E8R7B1_DESM0|nr:LSm family protein [Desulfurococcus mucosus]ADV65576.1 Small nuclear ribonucleoprotein, LSM family [Desulfurococcus mucosus DSM 2162]
MSETAHKILEDSIGRLVLIKTKDSVSLRGKLRSFDQHLNIVLDDTEEIRGDGSVRKLGTVVIRGDTVVLISPLSE